MALELRSQLNYSQGQYMTPFLQSMHTLVVETDEIHLPSISYKMHMCMTLCFVMMKIMKIKVTSWRLNSKNVDYFMFHLLLRYQRILHFIFIIQCKKMCKPKIND